MSDPFIAEIRMWGLNFAPRNWAYCNGQLLPISQNSALFSLLGTTYGGDGRTTFALPDLRGRMPIHFGQGPGLSSRNIGAKSGTEAATMPTHDHPLSGGGLPTSSAVGNESGPNGNVLATANDGESNFTSGSANGSMALTGSTDPTFSSGDNMPPFLAINFCIALYGIFPSRS